MIKQFFFILALVCILSIIHGCAGTAPGGGAWIRLEGPDGYTVAGNKETEIYEPYKKLNTIEGYEEFISKYPNNFWADTARLNIKNLRYAEYEQIDTIEGYKEFIEKYPDNPNTTAAERRIKIY